MQKQRKHYTKEEKLEIVLLSLEKKETIKELSYRFGIKSSAIYTWRSEYLKKKEAAFPGNGKKILTETERRIADLEKENRELKLEREILKKAVGIFSKNNGKYTNS